MKRNEKRLIHKALDGDLSRTETKRLKRKLEQDGRARREYGELKKVVKDTTKIRIDVPPDFRKRVMKDVEEDNKRLGPNK